MEENPANVSQLTLKAIERNRYMDNMLFASNSLESLRFIASEGIELFSSQGFELRKWVTNFHAKEILSSAPHCDLAAGFSQVNLGSSDSLPNSKALGLAWGPQDDKFCVNCKEFVNATILNVKCQVN